MIKKSYVPFYQSLIFLFLLAVVASVSKNTCISIFFNKFSSNIEKFSAVGLEFFNITFEFIEKKSQYKSFMTRKQQQLGENKKIRLWSTGNSYLVADRPLQILAFDFFPFLPHFNWQSDKHAVINITIIINIIFNDDMISTLKSILFAYGFLSILDYMLMNNIIISML